MGMTGTHYLQEERWISRLGYHVDFLKETYTPNQAVDCFLEKIYKKTMALMQGDKMRIVVLKFLRDQVFAWDHGSKSYGDYVARRIILKIENRF